MMHHRIPGVSGRGHAFTLLETVFMLVVVVVFSLLLAGVTKPLWDKPKAQAAASPENKEKPN